MPAPGEVIVTYLDMHAPPERPPVPRPEHTCVRRAHPPGLDFYRFLYRAVGERWQWTDRRDLGDDALAAAVQAPGVAVHVLYHRGSPAGFAELDLRHLPDAELVYFGLLPRYIGRGLGRFFMDWTLRTAFEVEDARRLWLHTCTLDHPQALSFYQKAGFMPYKRRKKTERGE